MASEVPPPLPAQFQTTEAAEEMAPQEEVEPVALTPMPENFNEMEPAAGEPAPMTTPQYMQAPAPTPPAEVAPAPHTTIVPSGVPVHQLQLPSDGYVTY